MTKKEILLDNGDRKKLLKMFNVTYPTVSAALKYKTKTLLAHKIREAAVEMGGRKVIESETN